MTSRAVAVGLGAVYLAASTVSPLALKTTPSDLDLYFWPSAETVVAGHPLLIYSTDPHAVFFNDNGPVGLIPLVPIAALANTLGWAGSLTGRAALTGAIVSLVALLLAYQAVRFIAAARGGLRRPLAVACVVLLAPALWIAIIDYGHVEQPVELCLILLAMTSFLSKRYVLTGIAVGAAVLTRTVAGFCAIPLMLAPLAARRIRPTVTVVFATTIGVGIAPFVLADAQAATHSLVTYRGDLPIGGGSFWIIARGTPLANLVKNGDVFLGAAVAIALVTITLRCKPGVASAHTGLVGLVTVASCCFPLFAKTVFPYYLLEPCVLAAIWWLARPGTSLNWRAVVPVLLTLDVLIVKAALISPRSTWGVVASLVSSSTIGIALALVTFDLLRSTANAPAARAVVHDAHTTRSAVVRDAT